MFVVCACVPVLFCFVCVVGSVSDPCRISPGPRVNTSSERRDSTRSLALARCDGSTGDRSDEIRLFTEDQFEYFSVCLVTQLNKAVVCSDARTRENGAVSRGVLGNSMDCSFQVLPVEGRNNSFVYTQDHKWCQNIPNFKHSKNEVKANWETI